MKKVLGSFLLVVLVIGVTVSKVLAENFSYKLSDAKANKNYSSQMMTISIDSKSYIIGFYSGQNVCVILPKSIKTNADNGIVSGDCVGLPETPAAGKVFNWREYSPNTFYTEMNSIIVEREKEGKSLVK